MHRYLRFGLIFAFKLPSEDEREGISCARPCGNSDAGLVAVDVPFIAADQGFLAIDEVDLLVHVFEASLALFLGGSSSRGLGYSDIDSGQGAHSVEQVVLEVQTANQRGQVTVEAVPSEGQPDVGDPHGLEPLQPVVERLVDLGSGFGLGGDLRCKQDDADQHESCGFHCFF